MFLGRPNLGRALLFSFTLLCICFLFLLYHDYYTAGFDSRKTLEAVTTAAGLQKISTLTSPPETLKEEPQQPPPQVEIVAASLRADDTSWFHRHLPAEWGKRVYVVDVDEGQAPLTVLKNKGREAMAYLTHIVDHYDTLADTTVFFHAARFAWHNDDPDYDAVPTLRRLRLDHVRRAGYVNLRCVWVIGCPDEIHPHLDAEVEEEGAQAEPSNDGGDRPPPPPEKKERTTKAIYKRAFEELLPDMPVPDVVAVSCCSQFAVTRETIRRRPQEDYVRFRDWLLQTPLTDDLSGRVMEFAWHIIFGKESVHCPSAQSCYCDLWGLCGETLACNEGSCEGRYTLPALATLPEHWPLLGWQGEDRNFTGPLD